MCRHHQRRQHKASSEQSHDNLRNNRIVYVPVSNPFKPMKAGVSSKTAIIFPLDALGGFGAGPPLVFFVSLLKVANSFFAVLCKFFHLSFTSTTVRPAVPTAFTASVISCQTSFFFRLVMLFVNLDWITARWFLTFSVITEISFIEKLGFLFLAFDSSVTSLSFPLSTLSAIFFSFPHAVEYFPALNRVVANNCFDWFIPTFNRGIVNHGINRFSGTPFYPWISYPGNKKFNRRLTSNRGLV